MNEQDSQTEKITLGQLARVLAAKMNSVRVEALSTKILDDFIQDGRRSTLLFNTPIDAEVALCVTTLGDSYNSGINAALERVKLQKLHAAAGDDSATVLDALVQAIEALRLPVTEKS